MPKEIIFITFLPTSYLKEKNQNLVLRNFGVKKKLSACLHLKLRFEPKDANGMFFGE